MVIDKKVLSKVCVFSALLVLAGFISEVNAQGTPPMGLKFAGDFRVRYENTSNQEPTSIVGVNNARNRGVVRFRAGISKEINDMISFGARIATGSPDDPNTADVTLGNFVDDLVVSLDRAYLTLNHKGLSLTGGKFANPFVRTDLVWDGDVNPQGITASYSSPGSGSLSSKITGIYSIIDEQTQAPDSYMIGGQGQFAIETGSNSRFTLAAGYYDYTIESLINADAGDTRSNNVDVAGTSYVSDFDLFNLIATLDLPGFGENYPIRFVGDYVKNLGAEVDEDQGFAADVFIGRASKKKDLRFRYGYSETKTDAVLAAFSNDNTTIATNYKQHTVTVDYVVLDNTTLNLIWYLHKRLDAPAGVENENISRVRVNAVVKF